ncbi:MAG: helix-turn-helix transcriptional regulator [Clostridia bacterium]|jgi:ribosome-binding protein aMBF1 (putative translation factor)|nr:helix-turn-helix transcriptional regulator [Clostridia bacterium]MBQ9289130.1 helix-turn-helix transcriptional regulator [Clostridia bacterium]MBR0217466.1 helix-turn-helix transcriptional regulator [Clostridia bacterium]
MGKSYAVRVRQFMENHKVSRNLLASMTQVYPTYIARMETGEVLPTEEWWNKFEVLEMSYRRKEPVI